MNNDNNFWTNSDVGLLLIRITFAGTFLMHGIHKAIYGVGDGFQLLADVGIPGQLIHLFYISEILAPVLILLGIYTRLSLITVVVTMVTVLYAIPFPFGLGVHGELNVEVQVLYTMVPLALFFTGPGRYRLLQNKSTNWLLD